MRQNTINSKAITNLHTSHVRNLGVTIGKSKLISNFKAKFGLDG